MDLDFSWSSSPQTEEARRCSARGYRAGRRQKVQRRRQVHAHHREALDDLASVRFPATPDGSEPNRWLTVIQVADEQTRDRVLDAMEAAAIEARPTWKPMHLQPVYADHRMYGGDVSEAAFASGICLPSGSSLADADQDRVVDALREALD